MKGWWPRLLSWDRRWSERLRCSSPSLWRGLAVVGAHLGDGLLWVVVAVLLLLWGSERLRFVMVMAAIAVLLSGAGSTAIKYLFRRPRPQQDLRFYASQYDLYSFPSGHAARMGAIALVVGVLYPSVWPLAGALALWVAWSRVAVGVHHIGDVLAGLIIGLIGGGCVVGGLFI